MESYACVPVRFRGTVRSNQRGVYVDGMCGLSLLKCSK